MTVKISDLTTQFSNSSILYTAIGLNVTNNSSAADSRLLNLAVNGNTKLSVIKDGRLTINANVNTSTILLQVDNKSNNILKVTPNVAKVNTTAYVKSYAEGYLPLSGSSLVLDLRKASVFSTTSTSISNIDFITPVTNEGSVECYSCSLVLLNGGNISGSVWTGANVEWPNGDAPTSLGSQPAILTFLNISNSSTWYGIISGKSYSL